MPGVCQVGQEPAFRPTRSPKKAEIHRVAISLSSPVILAGTPLQKVFSCRGSLDSPAKEIGALRTGLACSATIYNSSTQISYRFSLRTTGNMKEVVIFGAGRFAEVVRFYLENDSEYSVAGHTVD